MASCFRFLRHDPGIPTSICGGGNPLGEEIILARLSFNPPRRPRGVAAQLRPIVFNQWSAPLLHVAACTYHKGRSRGVFGPKAGHVVANSHAGRVAARVSTLRAGAAACRKHRPSSPQQLELASCYPPPRPAQAFRLLLTSSVWNDHYRLSFVEMQRYSLCGVPLLP